MAVASVFEAALDLLLRPFSPALARGALLRTLNACRLGPEDLPFSRRVHAHLVDLALDSDLIVATSLLRLATVSQSERIFHKLPCSRRDIVSWNALLSVYARHRLPSQAFRTFLQIPEEGLALTESTLVTALGVCSSPETLAFGKLLHAHVIVHGGGGSATAATALLTMYSKCGQAADARRVFESIDNPNVISWTASIANCSSGSGPEPLLLLFRMQQQGIEPSPATFVSLLSACTDARSFVTLKTAHAGLVSREMETNVIVGTALLTAYGKQGKIQAARGVFESLAEQRNIVTWNAMITVYAQLSCSSGGDNAFQLLHRMHQEGIKPNTGTIIGILNACTGPEALPNGKLAHVCISEAGIQLDVVAATAISSMYGRCGSAHDTQRMFAVIPSRNIVSWNAAIVAFARRGQIKDALALISQMQSSGVNPDGVTLLSILPACAGAASLAQGKLFHALAVRQGIAIGAALVSMYGRCGSLEEAHRMAQAAPEQVAPLWNSLISAYSSHGRGEDALRFFKQMQRQGVAPDAVTFLAVMCACSHAALLDDGLDCFHLMGRDCSIDPTLAHFNCVVDLLGRCGCLDEARQFIQNMPCQPDAVTWTTFLGFCEMFGCLELGKLAGENAWRIAASLEGDIG